MKNDLHKYNPREQLQHHTTIQEATTACLSLSITNNREKLWVVLVEVTFHHININQVHPQQVLSLLLCDVQALNTQHNHN